MICNLNSNITEFLAVVPTEFLALIDQQETLNEETVKSLREKCRAEDDWCQMRSYLDRVLGSRTALLNSFRSDIFKEQQDDVRFAYCKRFN